MSLFYFLILSLPVLNSIFLIAIFSRSFKDEFYSYLSKFFSVVFLTLIFALYSKGGGMVLSILELSPNISISLDFAKNQIFVLIIAIIWVGIVFYIEGVDKDTFANLSKRDFLIIFSTSIGLLNFMIFAANPYTAYLGYSVAIIVAMATLQKFIAINHRERLTFLFIASVFFELILVFICLCLLLKFSSYSSVDEISGWVLGLDSFTSKVILSLTLLIAIFNIINPLVIMIRDKIDYEDLNIFSGFVLLFIAPKFLLVYFSMSEIFGYGLFANYISGIYFNIMQAFIFIFIFISIIVIFIIKDFRKLFLAILFNQTLISILSLVLSSQGGGILATKIFINFLALSTVLFMTVNNIVQFMKISGYATMKGSFGSLRINNILLCFYFISIAGLAPPNLSNAIEVMSIANENGFSSFILIFILNSIAIIAIGCKIMFIAVQGSGLGSDDVDSSKEIDLSSQLTLTPLAITFIIILINFVI